MRKIAITTAFLLLLFSGVQAQSQLSDAGKPAAAVFTRDDTVRAVQRMFYRHRTGGWIWTAVAGLMTGRIISVAATTSSTAPPGSAGGLLIGLTVFGGTPAAIGIGKLMRFSSTKEEQTIALYQKSGLLPPYVRKRLKTKHFGN